MFRNGVENWTLKSVTNICKLIGERKTKKSREQTAFISLDEVFSCLL